MNQRMNIDYYNTNDEIMLIFSNGEQTKINKCVFQVYIVCVHFQFSYSSLITNQLYMQILWTILWFIYWFS